jgi:heme/copper-type cytochrome/quinol oxidase subunit 3
MTAERRVLDVSPLPNYAFGHHGLIWWGTLGFMVIEGSMFIIVLIAYFYFRIQVSEWPPSLPNPDVGFATANLLLMFASCLPAAIAKRAAEKFDLPRLRLWLTVLTVMAFASVAVRAFEYTSLNCRWDDNAYGSITWLLLSLHTMHLATDATDSAVLLALMVIGPVTNQRFVDASENSLYWYFIVLSWVPVYLTVYFAPRWL